MNANVVSRSLTRLKIRALAIPMKLNPLLADATQPDLDEAKQVASSE